MKQHNYVIEIMKLQAAGKIPAGQFSNVAVAHDNWCGIYSARRCNCNPTITIKPVGGNQTCQKA